jgi:hypothetical protein
LDIKNLKPIETTNRKNKQLVEEEEVLLINDDGHKLKPMNDDALGEYISTIEGRLEQLDKNRVQIKTDQSCSNPTFTYYTFKDKDFSLGQNTLLRHE